MRKIIVKQIDLLSSESSNKVIYEYLIYLMEGDVKLSCFNEFGESHKLNRVNQLLGYNPTAEVETITYIEFKNKNE